MKIHNYGDYELFYKIQETTKSIKFGENAILPRKAKKIMFWYDPFHKYKVDITALKTCESTFGMSDLCVMNNFQFYMNNSIMCSYYTPGNLIWKTVSEDGEVNTLSNPSFDKTDQAYTTDAKKVDVTQYNKKLEKITDPSSGNKYWIILIIALIVVGIICIAGYFYLSIE